MRWRHQRLQGTGELHPELLQSPGNSLRQYRGWTFDRSPIAAGSESESWKTYSDPAHERPPGIESFHQSYTSRQTSQDKRSRAGRSDLAPLATILVKRDRLMKIFQNQHSRGSLRLAGRIRPCRCSRERQYRELSPSIRQKRSRLAEYSAQLS